MPVDDEALRAAIAQPTRIHIVGIGGAGMNGIATILLALGHQVSGSDQQTSAVTDRLGRLGAEIFIGHERGNVDDSVALVTHSSAIPPDNPEREAANEQGIPDVSRALMLRAIVSLKRTIGVAGTHGKTTTTTMLSHAMTYGSTPPSWLIGGEVIGRDGGTAWNDGEYFLVEADESDGTFLELGAYGAIVTNIEPDHLEFYGSLDRRDDAISSLEDAFVRFVNSVPGPRVICLDDQRAAMLRECDDVVTYGTDHEADVRIEDVVLDRFTATFVVHEQRALPGEINRHVVTIQTTGLHNVRNATAAFALARELGVPAEAISRGLAEFRGVGRRFHRRGELRGATFVDEYAHLPGEVRAALAAAKAGKWARVVAVFQPHRYSRTAQVGDDFTGAFDDADLVVLCDVYGAGETPRPGVDGMRIVRAVTRGVGHPEVIYVPDRHQLADTVRALLKPGDLCVTLGAGDITKLADEVIKGAG